MPLDKEWSEWFMDRSIFKKDGAELQEYLQFRRRGKRVEALKGKGAEYKRSREKNKARQQINEKDWHNEVYANW